jgi:diguanylate cyclase (GGDEF)-like protein
LLYFILITLIVIMSLLYFARGEKLAKIQAQLTALHNELSLQKNRQTEFRHQIANLPSPTNQMLLDNLTGLPSYQSFEDRFQQVLNQSKRFSQVFGIMILNIDNFKQINADYGHEKGDLLLKEIAMRLQKTIRQVDTMARYVGDNFLFLLPQLSMSETVVYVAQRLLDNMVQPFSVQNQNITVTASIGIAIYPSDGDNAATLLKNGNEALQKAKSFGKNLYQFYQQDVQDLSERELVLKALVVSDDFFEHLRVDYQTYVNTKTQKVVGLQPLPNLFHPELGLIAFKEFVRIAEYADKVNSITEWLINHTAQKWETWQAQGFTPESLMLTCTLRQVEKVDFVPSLLAWLNKANFKPQQLMIEVADEVKPVNDTLRNTLNLLAEHGVKISLGIFLLGHLSLQKLNQLPINYLKIEKKLIQNITDHKDSQDILISIISYARNLKIGLLTEGVDQESQRQLLEELGCEIMHGRLFANDPMVKQSIA